MKKFTKKQERLLSEIYRRLNCLCNNNLDEKLLVPAYMSEINPIRRFGLVQPTYNENKGIINWYCLTEKGKLFFSNYVHNRMAESKSFEIYKGELILSFDVNHISN
jgi:hypothetical protein